MRMMMEAKIITQERWRNRFVWNFELIWWSVHLTDGSKCGGEREKERGGNGSLSRCKLGPLGRKARRLWVPLPRSEI